VTAATVLVTGTRAGAREAAIAAALDPDLVTALILEGLPDGTDTLRHFAHIANIHIARIAPGCLCCTGNLTMRVTLNRMLRHRPERLYISLATSAHLAQIQEFLSRAPYDALLTLTGVLSCDEIAP
jgi:pimeloyl-ACP methyl ester carboxylesterase